MDRQTAAEPDALVQAGVTFRYVEKLLPYEAALRATGIAPVRISPEEPRSLDGLHGLVLTGGTDVDPALYGEARRPESDEPDRTRDELELRLLQEALERDLPVLAICRGMQLFNVAHGGTLLQHLERAHAHRVRPPAVAAHEPVHRIRIERGTRLAAILDAAGHEVNSRHHQGVCALGSGLIVSARAQDGVIEAIERPDRAFAVAVQWHPEDCVASSAADRRLFQAFAEALAGR